MAYAVYKVHLVNFDGCAFADRVWVALRWIEHGNSLRINIRGKDQLHPDKVNNWNC